MDSPPAALFGRNLVAMVTPMRPDLSVDTEAVDALVEHLVQRRCDGLVVCGTTGEGPTVTEAETSVLVSQVARRAAGRARVIAGVGTNDTATTVHRARAAQDAGADALLVVAPYYSRPSQPGLLAHFRSVADATHLPVMLYDVPARSGVALTADTLVELSRHPRICAVKDAKGDLFEAMAVMAQTGLAYYCGSDELNLPYLSVGATGLLSTVGNVVAQQHAALIEAVDRGDLAEARAVSDGLLDLTEAMMGGGQGAVMAKQALMELGVIAHATVRPPLAAPEADSPDRALLTKALASTARGDALLAVG